MEFREIKKQSKVEMKQKVLLLIALLCTFVQGTRAQNTENVTFNMRSWDETNKKVVTKTETKSCKILPHSPSTVRVMVTNKESSS